MDNNKKLLMRYNLQFFAKEGAGGERTEDPTAKKLEDSRKEGQVAKSKEISMALMVLALFVAIRFSIGFVGERFLQQFDYFYGQISKYVQDGIDIRSGSKLINDCVINMCIISAPFLGAGFVVAFLGEKLQIKWKVTTKPMQPKFSKINPLSGFKRMFSAATLVELVKALLKIGAISYVVYTTISAQKDTLFMLYDLSVGECLGLLYDLVMSMGMKISIVLLVIGFADYLYQRWKYKNDNKMSKQEVKDEYKNQEGDPKVKGQQKQRMMQASQRRMMNSIPQADVVITNPTHFAVALQYEQGKGTAPVVVAKGADFLAAKIKDIARENDIVIMEDKKLARMLYYNVNIGSEIPTELYKAVAEIIAHVYAIKNKVV